MLETVSETRLHGGTQRTLRHESAATRSPMQFALYTPPRPSGAVLLYLSGLTCTEENVTVKAGAQFWCAQYGLSFLAPDTSPRGEGVADDAAYDLGQGAGFYLDADQSPWAPHFRMETYVMEDLLGLLPELGLDPVRVGITGHSMGGHGALTLALKHPERFRSCSAFSPIVAPSLVPWGQKAFAAYLGSVEAGAAHDATALVSGGKAFAGDLLVDTGGADPFLETQLQPWRFEAACRAHGQSISTRLQAGYDHSYHFVASFMGDHVKHHARDLA